MHNLELTKSIVGASLKNRVVHGMKITNEGRNGLEYLHTFSLTVAYRGQPRICTGKSSYETIVIEQI